MAKLKSGTRIYGDIKIDGGIYDSSNQVGIGGSVLMSTGVGIAWTTSSSLIKIPTSSSAPSSPSTGYLWYNTNLGRTFVYYDDGDSSQWVDAAPFNVGVITSLTGTTLYSATLVSPTFSGATFTSLLFTNGSPSSPSWYFTNSSTTGAFSPVAGTTNFVSVGSTVLSINPAGVVVTGVTTSTDFNSTSDINLKDNIAPIDNAIEKVLQISGVTFNWKNTDITSAGVIAQDVEKVLPEIVNGTDVKKLNYNGLIGLLVEAIKEQQKQIEELKSIINK